MDNKDGDRAEWDKKTTAERMAAISAGAGITDPAPLPPITEVAISPCRCGGGAKELHIQPIDDEREAYAVNCMKCDRWGPVSMHDTTMEQCVELWNKAIARSHRRARSSFHTT